MDSPPSNSNVKPCGNYYWKFAYAQLPRNIGYCFVGRLYFACRRLYENSKQGLDNELQVQAPTKVPVARSYSDDSSSTNVAFFCFFCCNGNENLPESGLREDLGNPNGPFKGFKTVNAGHQSANRPVALFANAACVLLLVSGLFKLLTVPRTMEYLAAHAPIFTELTWRQLLFLTGALETGCAAFVCSHPMKRVSFLLILWLSAIIVLFKSSLVVIGYKGPCHCMGFLGDWLGLDEQTLSRFAWGSLCFLLLGSVLSLLSISKRQKLKNDVSNAPLGAIVIIVLCLFGTFDGRAVDFKVSGEQQAMAVLEGRTSAVQNVSFTIVKIGTNWSIVNGYPEAGTKQYFAFIDGVPYTTTLVTIDGGTAGLVMEKLDILLDAAPAFARFGLSAFLGSQEFGTNLPVPFLPPRHPALHFYARSVDIPDPPSPFPKAIKFAVNKELFEKVSADSLYYFYGYDKPGRKTAKQLYRAFQETQNDGAEYQVQKWTNFEGNLFPATAILKSTEYDEKAGKFQRIYTFTVSAIEHPGDYRLLPPLAPNSWVQEVIGGTNYTYLSAAGQWLPKDEVIKVGTVKDTSPRPPPYVSGIPGTVRFLTLFLVILPICIWTIGRFKGRKRTQTMA